MSKTKRAVKILQTLKKTDPKTMLGSFSTKYSKFEILIGTILSARARDEVTDPICKDLFKKYPTPKKLASANPKDIERLIKRIGFYKNKTKMIIGASKKIVKDCKGKVPDTMEELLKLPGVGRKVAGCVLVYAHAKDAIPVDTHVHRLSNRLGLAKTRSPDKTEKELVKIFPKKYWQLVNDYFVSHGKNICKPITPHCSKCVIRRYCKRVGVKKSY